MTSMTLNKQKNDSIRLGDVPSGLRILTWATIFGLGITLYLGLFNVGTDVAQGPVQRIFYIHMPSFFGAFTAFIGTVIGGIMYLVRRDPKWDRMAVAGVEVGLALSLVNLLTGIAWMRPIWNSWWLWDPRLTSAAIMVLTYAAYLMLRAGIENPDTRRRFASVYGILAITTVVLTLVIIRIRPDTIHPAVIGPSPQNAQGEFDATTGVIIALVPALLFYTTIVPITLMWWRVRLENMLDFVEERK
ncbi:MAG: cytochrome c biogenesis protein CcsA, partial [Chloroflexota bacterium]